jgi:hypothetical protein
MGLEHGPLSTTEELLTPKQFLPPTLPIVEHIEREGSKDRASSGEFCNQYNSATRVAAAYKGQRNCLSGGGKELLKELHLEATAVI